MYWQSSNPAVSRFHHDVDEGDRHVRKQPSAQCRRQQLDRFRLAAGREQPDRPAVDLKVLHRELRDRQDVRLVVDHAGLAIPFRTRATSISPLSRGTLSGKRERDRGSRTLPRRDFDSARERRGHEVVNDGHAEAGRALAASGRVEGLEDLVPRVRCHAATRIPNNDRETVVPSVAGLAEYRFPPALQSLGRRHNVPRW